MIINVGQKKMPASAEMEKMPTIPKNAQFEVNPGKSNTQLFGLAIS